VQPFCKSNLRARIHSNKNNAHDCNCVQANSKRNGCECGCPPCFGWGPPFTVKNMKTLLCRYRYSTLYTSTRDVRLTFTDYGCFRNEHVSVSAPRICLFLLVQSGKRDGRDGVTDNASRSIKKQRNKTCAKLCTAALKPRAQHHWNTNDFNITMETKASGCLLTHNFKHRRAE
jgi:hypothetical protein